jgi:hypothetical protein
LLSRRGLLALETALASDDPRLLQGVTCAPPLLDAWSNRKVCAACALALSGWRGEGLTTVGDVEAYFHGLCDAADRALHEPAACRFFLNWYDDTPREEMRRMLLAEVRLELSRRSAIAA